MSNHVKEIGYSYIPTDYRHSVVFQHDQRQERVRTRFQRFGNLVALSGFYITRPKEGVYIYVSDHFRIAQCISRKKFFCNFFIKRESYFCYLFEK